MARNDRDHETVLEALRAAGWIITHPYGLSINWGGKTGRPDIGAELLFPGQPLRKLIVEVKNYPAEGSGVMAEFHRAIGQYLAYRSYFETHAPDYEVVKAVPQATYDGLLKHPDIQRFLQQYTIRLFVYDPAARRITQWIN